MGQRLLRPALVAVGLLLTASTGLSACLPPGQPLVGTLQRLETRHPNGMPIRALALLLPREICALLDNQGPPAEVQVRLVHLVFPDSA